jgi:conjugal transfer pilus assembly protein TraW
MAATVQNGHENLGRRAEDYAIAEMDLIEEMQQRLARIDWEARRREAIEQFWSKHEEISVNLPDAKERREVLIDPSVRVTEDVEDADGNVLVSAGQAFNPLTWVPLSKTIVVFKGTDPRQVSKAEELARAARTRGHGVILLTTAIQTDRGWQHLSELERTLSGAVYLLPQALVERFHLARIPATVVSRGQQLLVTEIPVGVPQ